MHKFRTHKLQIFILVEVLLIILLEGCADRKSGVRVIRNEAEQCVDVLVDGQLFTSYLYSEQIEEIKRPVFFPVKASNGATVTRGYPFEKKAGESTDKMHHIGYWFAYGDVNGYDFWTNSNQLPTEADPAKMGLIKHREIRSLMSGNEKGILDVTMDWMDPDGDSILQEDTRFVFMAGQNTRIIDRITTLTAVDERVEFKDNKEGMIAIRVTRALQMPVSYKNKKTVYTGTDGKPQGEPVIDHTGKTGDFLNSEGIRGVAAWGKRARWLMLTGVVEGDSVAVALIDHPENVGYPSYWHARQYGLLAANPFGQKIFSKGAEELNFTLEKGESTIFRHRLFIHSGATTPEMVETEFKKFANGTF